jgi:hypothetical protein
MKKNSLNLLLLLLVIAFFNSHLLAQNESFSYHGKTVFLNEKVINHFGNDYTQQLKDNNPDLLFYLNYFVENAYSIEDVNIKINDSEVKDLSNAAKSSKSMAPQFDPANHNSFNILAFEIQLTENQQVFKTGVGAEAIIVKSKKMFLDKYNTYRDSFLK